MRGARRVRAEGAVGVRGGVAVACERLTERDERAELLLLESSYMGGRGEGGRNGRGGTGGTESEEKNERVRGERTARGRIC